MILKWLTTTRLWRWLLLKVMPYIRFSTYYTDFTGEKFELASSLLREGDIILTRDKRKLTTFIIPGEWTHAVQVIFRNGRLATAEMDHHGLVIRNLFDVCKESDEICILRCVDYTPEHIAKISQVISEWAAQGVDYDVNFTLGIKQLYCSELIYEADRAAGQGDGKLIVDLSDIHGLNTKYISPDGLFAAKNVELIFE